MNKANLIDQMAKLSKLPKSTCKTALESFLKAVGQGLKNGKSIGLTGFGSFRVVKRKGRVGINPATRKKMQIPAKKVVRFRPGKALRDSVE